MQNAPQYDFELIRMWQHLNQNADLKLYERHRRVSMLNIRARSNAWTEQPGDRMQKYEYENVFIN